MRFVFIGTVVAGLLIFGQAQPSFAQESAATPEALPAVECSIEPVPFELLVSIVATPLADDEQIQASPTAIAIPEGEPVDDATASAARDTVTQLVACLNAGDNLRSLALYSDRFIQQAFAGVNLTRAMYDAQAANLNPRLPGAEVLLYSFGEVVMLEDGRVYVIVVGDDLASPGRSSGTAFYLIQKDERWYIDETVEDAT